MGELYSEVNFCRSGVGRWMLIKEKNNIYTNYL